MRTTIPDAATDAPPRAVTPPAIAPITADPDPGPLRALLHGFYDALWLLAILLASPWWLVRSSFDPAFRGMVRERLARGIRAPAGPSDPTRGRVLIHGVSVGEVKGAQAIVRAIEQQHPGLEIVISSTTRTGLEVARKLYPQRTVLRFPLDLSFVVRRFLGALEPVCVVLMELEIWPNFLRECNRAGVPVAVVNGRITQKSYGHYRWFRRTLPQFERISLFCVQSEEYAERFGELCRTRDRVVVTGNVKADGLRVGRVEPAPELVRLLAVRAGRPVLVAGSTHHPEERIVCQAWRAGAPHARLVLVPRHPPRASEVVRALEALGQRPQLLTALRAGEQPDPDRPAIVDTIGELEGVYALADLVYVGGSLVPHGGQNMLEPAAQGRAVVYGPHVDNFAQEAALLEDAGASRRVRNPAGLERALRELFADAAARERMGAAGLQTVETQKGATALTLAALAHLWSRSG